MLNDKITSIKGIGPRRAELFGKLGLTSLYELLYFLPRSYKDYSRISSVEECSHGDDAALFLMVDAEPKLARIRRGLDILSVSAHDGSGKIRLTWYNQSYRKAQLSEGMKIYACGRIDSSRGKKMINPALFDAIPGILPVYSLVHGINQRLMREAVKAAIKACKGELEDMLPVCIRKQNSLPALEEAICELHFPHDMDSLHLARRRLAFEDMLVFQLMTKFLKERRGKCRGVAFQSYAIKDFLSNIPFEPTKAQARVMAEIADDMSSDRPMNRLIQGDVGSGKTIPAMYAMAIAVHSGYQAVLLAPTEILSRQHYGILKALFGERAVILHGGMKKSEREAAYSAIATGEALAIVGTHALLQESLSFYRLGLVIADEQHRFGVQQRAKLKGEGSPDMLIMSATPIPRTLTLLLYGDLDLSVLDELPPGRKPVTTRFVPDEKRGKMYDFIVEQLRLGRQAYVVCPLVEPSEELEDAVSAIELYNELRKKLPVRVALLHGQMKSVDKQAAIESFRAGNTDILVSTTVIEVGVDVPNASVMAIENADRFGLAQLHQLRGRVGRGSEASYCFLLSRSKAETAKERLSILTQTQNGFEIAQKDLSMRGPGELLGQRQHGVSELKALMLAADMDVFYAAQKTAEDICENKKLFLECSGLIEKAEGFINNKEKQIAMN